MTKQWKPLTDPQWATISHFFDLKRKRKHDLPHRRTGQMLNIILWLLRDRVPRGRPRGGVIYPKTGPIGRPSTTILSNGVRTSTFERINSTLNQLDRKQVGKEAFPSVLHIDTQSVKLNPMLFEHRGTDANKQINGRKRHLVVDTQGRLWVAAVHTANQADGPAAISLISDVLWRAGERLLIDFLNHRYGLPYRMTT